MSTKPVQNSRRKLFFFADPMRFPLSHSELIRLLLVSLIVAALAATIIGTVYGMVPEKTTVIVDAYTKDRVPEPDQVTIRVYPTNIQFNDVIDLLSDAALIVQETEEGRAELRLKPGE